MSRNNRGNYHQKPKPPGQTGTGLHIDLNPYNLWQTEIDGGKYKDLDRWRPFQSFLVCSDAPAEYRGKDGGLEIVPGFHHVCEAYFKSGEYRGRNLVRWGTYNTKFSVNDDRWIYESGVIQEIQRIPATWQPPQDNIVYNEKAASETASAKNNIPLCSKSKALTQKQMIAEVRKISAEHAKLEYSPVKEGDIVFWDIRMAHQNTKSNDSPFIRHVLYFAYMAALEKVNGKRIAEYQDIRKVCKHPSDFPKRFSSIESNAETINNLPALSQLGKLVYGMEKYDTGFSLEKFSSQPEREAIQKGQKLLTERHIAYFKRYGYVVVEGVVAKEFIARLKKSTQNFLTTHGINIDIFQSAPQKVDWEAFEKMSGTFGGMLESFWLREMEEMRTDPVAYGINVELMRQTWSSGDPLFENPFQNLNPYGLWVYLDRQNLRFPTTWEKPAKPAATASSATTTSTPAQKAPSRPTSASGSKPFQSKFKYQQ